MYWRSMIRSPKAGAGRLMGSWCGQGHRHCFAQFFGGGAAAHIGGEGLRSTREHGFHGAGDGGRGVGFSQDKATPEMIERAHETATAWKAYDPEATRASEQIRDQVQSSYGIDVNNTGADERSVSAALARARQGRLEAESERNKASAARTDEARADAAVAGANRQDNTAQKVQAGAA